ncbi:F-box/WD repeat-containing protein 12 [Choloepus didactylus]|uniref:F-box/WD repeat-containing protein 12 n=1 Tax=Choloepus didactylus TaxID=27675 RepID=UPI00189CF7BF|nr:F-box/WD repeat-containing protein 12 [Choloepus didactylus]
MEIRLPDLPLLRIFSFLDPFSLLRASQVNKQWNNVADNHDLWRKLCVSRWNLCNLSYECLCTQTWKQFVLNQIKQEYRMALVQPEDFNYREVSGNLGILGPMAYLSGTSPTMDGHGRSILCTVSSKQVLYAWDVQAGTIIWSSPVQRSRIMNVATLPQMHLAFTVDLAGTIKVWNCQDGDALAAFTLSKACFSLEAFLRKDGAFVLVGNSEGDIYTLSVPGLGYISKVNAFRYSVDHLVISPEKKWIFASGNHQHILPKVFFTECLLRPREGEPPLSLSLPFANCCRACWAPRKKNRLTVMFRRGSHKKTGFTTFDITTERTGGKTVIKEYQIASFMLPGHMEPPVWMGACDGQMIVFESGSHLFLFTINGLLLQRFEDHQRTISDLWADSVHVLTTSVDDSVHLYMWEEEGCYPHLRSRCHLDFMASDQAPSWRAGT